MAPETIVLILILFLLASASDTCIPSPRYAKPVHYSSRRNEEIARLAQEGNRRWSMLQSMTENTDCWKVGV